MRRDSVRKMSAAAAPIPRQVSQARLEQLRQSILQNNTHMQCHARVKSYTNGSHTNSLLNKSADRLSEFPNLKAVTYADFDNR